MGPHKGQGEVVCPKCGETRLVEVQGRTAFCNCCAKTFPLIPEGRSALVAGRGTLPRCLSAGGGRPSGRDRTWWHGVRHACVKLFSRAERTITDAVVEGQSRHEVKRAVGMVIAERVP